LTTDIHPHFVYPQTLTDQFYIYIYFLYPPHAIYELLRVSDTLTWCQYDQAIFLYI